MYAGVTVLNSENAEIKVRGRNQYPRMRTHAGEGMQSSTKQDFCKSEGYFMAQQFAHKQPDLIFWWTAAKS